MLDKLKKMRSNQDWSKIDFEIFDEDDRRITDFSTLEPGKTYRVNDLIRKTRRQTQYNSEIGSLANVEYSATFVQFRSLSKKNPSEFKLDPMTECCFEDIRPIHAPVILPFILRYPTLQSIRFKLSGSGQTLVTVKIFKSLHDKRDMSMASASVPTTANDVFANEVDGFLTGENGRRPPGFPYYTARSINGTAVRGTGKGTKKGITKGTKKRRRKINNYK
jgi:hypothetical protein